MSTASKHEPLLASSARLACCTALLGLATPLAAQEDAPRLRTLTGTVVEAESGVPLPGASVTVADRRRPVFTDAQGRFAFPDMPPGSHALVVTQLGYDTLATTVELGDDQEGVVLHLRPDPVVLQGVRVVSDRLQRRRNAVTTSVRAFDQAALRTAVPGSALDFLRTRANLELVPCISPLSRASCAYVRGRPTPVTVYIDDSRVVGSLEILQAYRPEDLYLVEVYSSGRQVRVYTNWYIGWSARTGRRPTPVLVW